jgi:hypothetical protein
MHLITEDPMKNSTSTASSTKSSLGSALKNKIKEKVGKVKNYVGTAHNNYKNRSDDSNKYRGVGYWNKNTN